jgi:hypothetical protein|tara:strand:+ start:100 stop:657 length:558 start_codon:yes stop_codon:yes gene_type:complete
MALKIKLLRIAGTPTTSNLTDGEIAHNTVANTLHVRIGSTIHTVGSSGDIDLSAVAQDIIPDGNGTRNLGSASKRFGELFLAGETINLGGATISSDGTGTIAVSANGVTLPDNSQTASGEKLAIADTEGTPIKRVPLFTASGGLSTAAVTFTFKTRPSKTRVFNALTLANGNSLSATAQEQIFEF